MHPVPVTSDTAKCIRFMVFGLYLARTDANPLNLGFNIPFHLYIHDHDLEQASGTLTCGVFQSTYDLLMLFGYLFFLAQMDTS